jgi:hypothetical protein
MTIGHLLFAAATAGYILIADQLERRDVIALFSDCGDHQTPAACCQCCFRCPRPLFQSSSS